MKEGGEGRRGRKREKEIERRGRCESNASYLFLWQLKQVLESK